jgi:hypothetical protein
MMPLSRPNICANAAIFHVFMGIVLTAVLLVLPPFMLLGALQTTLRYASSIWPTTKQVIDTETLMSSQAA